MARTQAVQASVQEKAQVILPKYDWHSADDDYEPLPAPGMGAFWFGALVGALIEAGLILIFAFIFWVL